MTDSKREREIDECLRVPSNLLRVAQQIEYFKTR